MLATEFIFLLPFLVLLGTILGVLVLTNSFNSALVSLMGLAVMLWTEVFLTSGTASFLLNPSSVSTWLILLATATTATLILLGEGYCARHNLPKPEFNALLLLALLGIKVMLSSQNLIPLYVGLEMMSLSFYVLVAFTPRNPKAAEGALKYFVLGGLASGLILYGISLLYGLSGSLDLSTIAQVLSQGALLENTAVKVAALLILVGVLFKLSIIPFHMWTPDTYQGASLPVMLTLATLGKIAGVGLFIQIFYHPLAGVAGILQLPMAVLAALSMLVGAILAIQQQNIQRLLAFSSITHMGFVLMALLTFTTQGLAIALLFTAVYVVTTVGTGASILALRHQHTTPTNITDLNGLNSSHPALAAVLLVTLLSLAGLPPFVGFFAKFYVFEAAYQAGFGWLVLVGAFASAIAVFYSLMVLKSVYFGAGKHAPVWETHTAPFTRIIAISSAIILVVLFIWHQPLLQSALVAAEGQPYIDNIHAEFK